MNLTCWKRDSSEPRGQTHSLTRQQQPATENRSILME